MNFFTNYYCEGSKIYLRYIEDGKRKREIIDDYEPHLFVETNRESKSKSLEEKNLRRIDFSDMWAARRYIKTYRDIDDYPLYGYLKFESTYISERFPETTFDSSFLKKCSIDIENEVENSSGMKMNDITEQTPDRINIISISVNKKMFTFLLKDVKDIERFSHTKLFVCDSEKELLLKFLEFFRRVSPDILTGWNIEKYDIPYLTNRCMKVVGEEQTQKLSPWEIIKQNELRDNFGKTFQTYDWIGVSIIDYLPIYKKFVLAPRDSYSLDNIAKVELKQEKHKHKSGIIGYLLYREYWDDFAIYNIKDVSIINDLEDKLSLIELTMTIAYIAGVNYRDVLSSMRVWDNLIYRYLKNQNKFFPVFVKEKHHRSYEGAYVKEPKSGKYEWIVSFDVTSEYPSIIRGLNISPETIIDEHNNEVGGVEKYLNNPGKIYSQDYCVGINGAQYRKDIVGVMPELVRWIFADRKKYKGLKFEYEKKGQMDESKRYDLLQGAFKVLMNSLYGCMGNRYFRFYDVRNAEAITLTGQAMIRFVNDKINQSLSKVTKIEKDRIITIDTDSGYFDMSDIVKLKYPNGIPKKVEVVEFLDNFSNKIIQPIINKSMRIFADSLSAIEPDAFQMDREVICDVGIFVAKKRYILNMLNNEGISYLEKKNKVGIGKRKVMGLEAIKSSTPEFARKEMLDIFDIFLYGNEEKYQSFVKEKMKEFCSSERDPEEIAFNRVVNHLTKYENVEKSVPINSRSIFTYHKLIESQNLDYPRVSEGEKIKFLYLKKQNPLGSHVVGWPPGSFPDVPEVTSWIDIGLQFEKAFMVPVKMVSKAIGWNETKTSSIEELFW